MAMPDYQDFMLPLLRAISDGQEHRLRDVAEELIASTDLTDEERVQRLPSGKQTVVANRIGWASTYLKKAGLLDSPRWGVMRLTEDGRGLLGENIPKIDSTVLERYPSYVEFRRLTPEETTALESLAKFGPILPPHAQEEMTLKVAFEAFHSDPQEQLRVQVRRSRAGQLRQLLSRADQIDLQMFNHEAWALETAVRIGSDSVPLFGTFPVDAEQVARVRAALEQGTLELHGNSIWGSGDRPAPGAVAPALVLAWR